MSFRHLVLAVLFIPLASFGQYVLNGTAVQESCNCYTLTQAVNNQVGSVWNENLIDLSDSFDFTFDIFLGNVDQGADGIVFGLQPLSTSVGVDGGGMGMEGITPSIGVFIDTYQNLDLNNDPWSDHLAINANGDVSHFGGPNDLAGPLDLPEMEDGVYHILRVEWDAVTTTLTATIDGDYTLSYSGDLINALFGGDPEVFWGFTSATGGLNNQQGFCTGVYPAISVSESIACPGLPITFSENSVVFGGTTELLWDFGDGTTSVDSIFDHTYSDTGEYDVTLTVTDQNGCSAQEVINVIVDSPTLQLAVSDTSICQGEQVLLDASYVLPEPPPCEFTIEMFDSFGDGWNGCSLLITGDGEELYNITLENGSEGTETFILDPNLLIEMIFIPNAWEVEISFDIYTSNGDILVSGSGFGESEEMVFQGMVDCPSLDNSYVLAWSPVNSLSFSEDSLSATTFPDANSIFEVQLSNDAGCLISESIEVQVSNMIHTDSVTISECNESTGEIFISSIGGLGQYTYSMVDSGWVNLTGEFLDLAPGFYSISVFDETECFSLLEYEVTEDTCALEIFIPNVFTPNGDDVNEAFQIELDGGEDPLMRIYNRWGRLIYETKDVQNGWNGQVAGFNASEGTYFYVVQVTEAINNELRTFKGTMSLLR